MEGRWPPCHVGSGLRKHFSACSVKFVLKASLGLEGLLGDHVLPRSSEVLKETAFECLVASFALRVLIGCLSHGLTDVLQLYSSIRVFILTSHDHLLLHLDLVSCH